MPGSAWSGGKGPSKQADQGYGGHPALTGKAYLNRRG